MSRKERLELLIYLLQEEYKRLPSLEEMKMEEIEIWQAFNKILTYCVKEKIREGRKIKKAER